MKHLSLLCTALAAVAALPAFAAGSGMQAGQWEYTMKMEMPGMPMEMPATTYKHCLTQAEIDKGDQYNSDPNQKGDCEVKNLKQTATGASYDIACKDGSNGHYDFTSSQGTMTGKGTMNTQGYAMTTNFSAKRIGDCSK